MELTLEFEEEVLNTLVHMIEQNELAEAEGAVQTVASQLLEVLVRKYFQKIQQELSEGEEISLGLAAEIDFTSFIQRKLTDTVH